MDLLPKGVNGIIRMYVAVSNHRALMSGVHTELMSSLAPMIKKFANFHVYVNYDIGIRIYTDPTIYGVIKHCGLCNTWLLYDASRRRIQYEGWDCVYCNVKHNIDGSIHRYHPGR